MAADAASQRQEHHENGQFSKNSQNENNFF